MAVVDADIDGMTKNLSLSGDSQRVSAGAAAAALAGRAACQVEPVSYTHLTLPTILRV